MKFTTKQAAEYLGIAAATIQKQCKHGRIKAERFGHVWQIDEEEVERYRCEQKGKRGAPQGNKNAVRN